MGFFDKIKGAVKAVTGGAAKVTMEVQPETASPGSTVGVKLEVTSTGGEVKSAGMFIDLRGTENLRVKKNASQQLTNDLVLSKSTFNQEFQIAPEFVLGADETKLFEGTFEIPADIQPSYSGVYSTHTWEIRGRMEARGNDPDTGFQLYSIR